VTASATLEVLAARSRRDIVDALRDGAQPVNALVARLALSQPAVSKHLRILREAGLVRVHADGQRRLYQLRPEPLIELAEWLEPYREMWVASLDRLERHLDAPTPPHRRKRT
jgi:DNA-binding transcriptional ArsR family regulator